VFGWTTQKFPFTVKTAHTLKIASCTSSLLRAKRFTTSHMRQQIIQTEKDAERLRCVGNSSRNEIGSGQMKYWEIIADNLHDAGWSLGWVSALDLEGRTIWIADAHRDNGKRFIVRADEKLRAFLELQRVTRESFRFPSAE
jgi:hypothetical protein